MRHSVLFALREALRGTPDSSQSGTVVMALVHAEAVQQVLTQLLRQMRKDNSCRLCSDPVHLVSEVPRHAGKPEAFEFVAERHGTLRTLEGAPPPSTPRGFAR
mmetsp:Transcript_78458/g.209644  ORF Transcript_78458/g.209644 Transcript_78458/m.209644 type:complete len:103 (-) Transcript_78458:60-368(-)